MTCSSVSGRPSPYGDGRSSAVSASARPTVCRSATKSREAAGTAARTSCGTPSASRRNATPKGKPCARHNPSTSAASSRAGPKPAASGACPAATRAALTGSVTAACKFQAVPRPAAWEASMAARVERYRSRSLSTAVLPSRLSNHRGGIPDADTPSNALPSAPLQVARTVTTGISVMLDLPKRNGKRVRTTRRYKLADWSVAANPEAIRSPPEIREKWILCRPLSASREKSGAWKFLARYNICENYTRATESGENYMSIKKIPLSRTAEAFRARMTELGLDLPIEDAIEKAPLSPLAAPLDVGGFKVGNRYAVHPMEGWDTTQRSEEHTSELQSRENLVCRL